MNSIIFIEEFRSHFSLIHEVGCSDPPPPTKTTSNSWEGSGIVLPPSTAVNCSVIWPSLIPPHRVSTGIRSRGSVTVPSVGLCPSLHSNTAVVSLSLRFLQRSVMLQSMEFPFYKTLLPPLFYSNTYIIK